MADNGNSSARMLLVSREPSAVSGLWSVGQANSWQLDTASSGLEALERVQSGLKIDLILLDLVPGDGDALHTLRWLRRMRPELPIILLSPPEDNQQMLEAVRLGAQDYLLKPCQEQQLERVLRHHLDSRRTNEAELAGEEIEQIGGELFFVAASSLMRKLRARAELLAQVNVPVLILGESGSGKEIAARLIHKLSVRSGLRFLKVNCAALPADLLESELFGYERGAFTGAMRTKQGKFELCHGGTILLDEIAEMPVNLQAKLLHVLQDQQFFRLGGETTVKVDVRILAATNVNVEHALAEKKLREDLYYRLSTFTVHVPALRQRKDEIPLLLGHFMKRMAQNYRLVPRSFSTAALEACQQYSWPGNLRELENFVKRYLVIGEEALDFSALEPTLDSLPTETLPATVTSSLSEAGSKTIETRSGEDRLASLKSLVRNVKGEAERTAIAGALEETHWNRKAAARLLSISYRGLLYKIEQYHMNPPATYPSHFAPSGAVKGSREGS